MKFIGKTFLLVITATMQTLFPQSNINPNISAIGSFNIFTNFIKGSEEYGKLNFETPGFELFIDGYLNPYSRAAVDIAYEDDEFALEEIYAEILRGLPLDLQVKAGKYLLPFGKLNTSHPHTWPFLTRPLSHRIFFGEEGFNDIGFNVSFILPTESVYTSFDIGIYKGDAIGKTELSDPDNKEDLKDLRGINPMILSRLAMFYDINDFNNIEIGLNGAYGLHAKSELYPTGDSTAAAVSENLYSLYAGTDFKYKFRPDSYTSLTVQAEGIINNRDVIRLNGAGLNMDKQVAEKITVFGGFIYFDYQFLKKFSIGVRYDFTFGIIGDEPGMFSLINDDENSTSGISGWIGFYPVEETLAFKLGAEHLIFNYEDGTDRDGETVLRLQLLFSLGPHKAHQF